MPAIIDVSFACGSEAGKLAAAGVKTVIRYYARSTGLPTKRLTRAEAAQFAAAGIGLAAVHEIGGQIGGFNHDVGFKDAAYSAQYAATAIDQPAGSAIYFAIDSDATPAQISGNVIPYFQGVQQAMGQASRRYRVGVYGGGAVCKAVLDQSLADLAWLAQSTGWTGFQAFQKSKRWALLQGPTTKVAGIECDTDEANPAIPDFGGFTAGAPVILTPQGVPMLVNARSGLNLRSGPGLEYASLKLLPLGALVHAGKTVGDWVAVDLQGDGATDGFVNRHYLAESAGLAAPALSPA